MKLRGRIRGELVRTLRPMTAVDLAKVVRSPFAHVAVELVKMQQAGIVVPLDRARPDTLPRYLLDESHTP